MRPPLAEGAEPRDVGRGGVVAQPQRARVQPPHRAHAPHAVTELFAAFPSRGGILLLARRCVHNAHAERRIPRPPYLENIKIKYYCPVRSNLLSLKLFTYTLSYGPPRQSLLCHHIIYLHHHFITSCCLTYILLCLWCYLCSNPEFKIFLIDWPNISSIIIINSS